MKNPMEKTNTRSAAPSTPGSVIGTKTRQKMRVRPAPMPRAAISTRSSRPRIAEAIGKTAKGIRKCVIPTITPNSLRTSASGSAIRPAPSSELLMSPRFERIDNQPKARVRTEIQKGMKMQSSVKSRATGPPRTHKSATA